MKHNKERFLRIILLVALLIYYLCSYQNVLAEESDINDTDVELAENVTEIEKIIEEDQSDDLNENEIINDEEELTDEIKEETSDESIENTEDEIEELSKEDILNLSSDGIVFEEEYATIYGNIKENNTTVSNIKEKINISNLINNYNIEKINIIDEFGNLLNEEDIVDNKCKIIIISKTFISIYNITFYKDYNLDNIITEEDINHVIESIIEKEEDYTTEEVSYIDYIVNNETYELPEEETPEEIIIETNIPKETYVGEEIEVQYTMNKLNTTGRITISGSLNYNQELLKLTNIQIPENILVNGNIKNNHFIYILEPKETIIITLKFIVLKEGITQIEINNINSAINGIKININSNINEYLNIKEYGKGGDIPITENNPTTNTNININTNISKTTLQPNKENNEQSHITATTISLNNDTYIKELHIEGYDIEFDMTKYEYSIEITNEINSLPLNILLNSDTSSYHIKGNNLKNEKNKITITVQAEDGSVRNYIINVTKKEEDTTSTTKINTTKNNNQSKNLAYKIIPIILVVLILIDIIYILRRREK